MKRVCSGCGILTDKRRCADCERKVQAQRGPRPQYSGGWSKLRVRAIREHPWCSECGTPGTASNPLTGDHITPHRAGGKNVRSNIQVLCMRCNSSKGARLPSGGA